MGTRRLGGSFVRSALIATVVLSVAAVAAASSGLFLKANLLGTNEIQVTDLDSTGKASVRIDVEGGEVCFDISFRDGGTANRAHIHRGVAGANGPIVVPFFDLEMADDQTDPRLDALESRNRFSDCVDGDPAILAEIQANPAGFYVNLHNARFPAGFVRGQLGGGGGG